MKFEIEMINDDFPDIRDQKLTILGPIKRPRPLSLRPLRMASKNFTCRFRFLVQCTIIIIHPNKEPQFRSPAFFS